MGYKPKTRVVIPDGKSLREVIAIRELTSGDLNILVRSGKLQTAEHMGAPQIMERHISVHRSPSSNGTAINYTFVTDEGRKESQYAYITDSKKKLLSHAVSQRLSCPGYTDTEPNIRDKDRVRYMLPTDSAAFSMIFSLFVSEPGRRMPQFPGFNLLILPFSHFSLAVYYTYAVGPSHWSNYHINTMTSPPRVNGEGGPPFPGKPNTNMAEILPTLLRHRQEILLRQLHHQSALLHEHREEADIDDPAEVMRKAHELALLNFVENPADFANEINNQFGGESVVILPRENFRDQN